MNFSLRPCVLALALMASSLSSVQAAEEKVTLNFVNSDIESAVKAAGLITGKNFMIDPRVKGTINIVSNQPVSRDLVYPILLSALRQQGFAAIESNGVIKIMPEADAKGHGGIVLGKKDQVRGDKIMTQIYPLKFQSANQLVGVLKPLVSPNNVINAYAAGNTLVVTDYAENLARINRVIDSIDQPSTGDLVTLQVKHATALDIAQLIGRMMPEVYVQGVQSPMQTPEGVKRTVVIADVRSNQLLVRSEAAAHLQQIRQLVESLDAPGAPGATANGIHVVYLRNADAARLANTLKGILTGQSDSSTSSSSNTSSGSSTLSSSLSSSSSSSSSSNTSGSSSSSGGLGSNSSTTTTSSAPQNTATSVNIGGVTVMIQADSTTNSLIINAPDHVYNNLRAVIDRLDVRRAQVYIEAMIAEVNASKAAELGVQWAAAGGGSDFGGGVISSISPTATNLATLYSGYQSGSLSVPTGIHIGLFNGDPTNGTATLGMLASAIESNGDGNILSTPNLLMLDNEEAKIMVGQNIPIVTGSYTTSGSGSTNPFTTVERKDVGILLKVKPQVSDGGSITLTVQQEVSSVDSSVNTSGAGLATKVRTIDTKVLVDNNQTIVLGGLIEEKVSGTQSKVPLLGDIPVLGSLFRYDSRSREKVNLMVFLRPRILRDSESTAALSNERYQYLRAEQNAFNVPKHLLLPDLPKVTLPESAAQPTAPAKPDVTPLVDLRQAKDKVAEVRP